MNVILQSKPLMKHKFLTQRFGFQRFFELLCFLKPLSRNRGNLESFLEKIFFGEIWRFYKKKNPLIVRMKVVKYHMRNKRNASQLDIRLG